MTPNNRKARQLLEKYLRGRCTPEEIDLLHRWYDQLPEYSIESLSDLEPVEDRLRNAVWSKIKGRRAPVRTIVYRVSAAAAVIGFLILSAVWWAYRSPHLNEAVNLTAGVRRVLLPDSTIVWLNAHSSLHWAADFATADRAVELEGEGYFEVVKKAAHPFRVLTKDYSTEVLGTSFNVECYRGESRIRVALVQGSVQVVRRDGRQPPTRLSPGQIAMVEEGPPGTMSVTTGNATSYGAWKAGGFVLQDVPLEDALQRLCHKFGYRLNDNYAKKDRKKLISTAYSNDSFEEILAGLLYVNHLSYSIRDSVITVY